MRRRKNPALPEHLRTVEAALDWALSGQANEDLYGVEGLDGFYIDGFPDDNLYYRGRFYPVGTSDERLFMPLDWAMNNAGATYIKYRNPDTGKWEIL